jgi:hypothetical protein
VLNLDPELYGASQVFGPALGIIPSPMHADILQVGGPLILSIEASYVRLWPRCLHYHSNPVEFVVPGMEDMPTHDQTVVPQYLSNAAVRSAAISSELRPSIM